MKRLFIGAIVLLFAAAAPASDTTAELLDAPWVRDQLRFQVTADGKLQAARDASRTYVDVQDGSTWVLSEQRDLVFRSFNPLLLTIATSETAEPDVNFGSLAKLLDAMKSTSGDLALGRSSSGKANRLLEDVIAHIEAPSPQALPASGKAAGCPQYEALQSSLEQLHDALNESILDAETFKEWTERTTSAEGVKGVRENMAAKVKELERNLELMSEVDKRIIKEYAKPNGEKCETVQVATLAMIYEVARRMSDIAARRRQLAADLKTLNDSLATYTDSSRWRQDSPNDYIVCKLAPDFAKVKLLSITAKPRSLSVEDNVLKVMEGKPAAATIRLRHYSLFAPEFSAGAIHTDLKYPKYGTAQQNGQTVVAKAGTEDAPLGAAVMINFVCRCWTSSVIYPLFQLGATNARQYPGFTVGGGLRLIRAAPLAIVVGKIYSWYDDLDGLNVGQTISGTAELQSHLKRKQAKPATYWGVQYNF